MKTSFPFWLGIAFFLIIVAFVVGQYYEINKQLQIQVASLNQRISQLEIENLKREERWGWICRICSKIPFVGKYLDK